MFVLLAWAVKTSLNEGTKAKAPQREGLSEEKGLVLRRGRVPYMSREILPANTIHNVISTVNIADNLTAARLLDYFSSRTPWHRSLWNAGAILALREVLEASEAHNAGHLSERSIKGAVTTALRLVKGDPGIGSADERRVLTDALTFNGAAREEILFQGMEYEQVRETLERVTPGYFERWAAALASDQPPAPERASRAIAAHLLDTGFNSNFLHRWWNYRLRIRPTDGEPFATLVAEANELSNQPERDYEVLVPFPSELKPPKGLLPPESWLNAAQVSAWVTEHNLTMPTGFHQQGGLLLKIKALDAESAVQLAAERVELFAARVLLSLRKVVQNCGVAWIAGETRTFSVERHIRGIKIGAMHRENRIWLESEADPFVDPAIELLAPLQSGATTTAIAGGWAAIESLLGEPKNKKADPAERLATIVACSFPRAELTYLAYSLTRQSQPFAAQVAEMAENREKSTHLAQMIIAGTCPEPQDWSDRAAILRVRDVLVDPQSALQGIRDHVHDSFARLYRQRNLILHAGKTRAVALRSTLRGATPLVGAGLDRICHARFADGITPIRLAGRARTALGSVQPGSATACVTLLGES